ncbi:MAG: hypothetical protein U0Q55_02515 [Vicinamibacterales bacterium]
MTRRALVFLLVVLFAAAGPVAAQQENLKAAALIGLARTRRDAGDLADAARYFAAARATRPLTADELAEYFWILRPESPREALGVARDVLRTTPRLTAVREGAIAAALDLGDESTVQAFAEEGRMLDASTAVWYRRLGDSYLRLRDYTRAADAFAQAVRQKDRLPDDVLAFAVALTAAERHAEVIDAWKAVPRELVAERLDLQRLELQAIARAAAPALATARLDEWLTHHPEDRLIRGWAVDAWERAGSPARALDTLRPLMEAPDPAPWLRRGATLAMQVGRRADAITAYEGLLTEGAATRADKVTYIGLALRSAADQRAVGVLDDLLAAARGCDDQLLPFVERMAGADATDRVLREARKPGCADARWGRRAVERAVAERRFTDALGVIDRMQRRDASMTRTRGLLLAWTGDQAGAIDVLTPVLAAAPADTEVRLTLVDANRALGRAYAAWQVARVLVDQPGEAGGATVLLANVALEADQPDAALRLARSGMATNALVEVLGRAHLAMGNPALAVATLRGRTDSLSPPAALALIDATAALEGPRAAATLAAGFDGSQPAWEDVAVRQLELARASGRADSVSTLERRLCTGDNWPCHLATAEAALMAGRPLDALKTAEGLHATGSGRQRRLDELRAWALAALGEHAKAGAILTRLIESTPDRIDLVLESLVMRWLSAQTTSEPVLNLLRERAPAQYAAPRTRGAGPALAGTCGRRRGTASHDRAAGTNARRARRPGARTPCDWRHGRGADGAGHRYPLRT